jgi:hypothetical protein
MFVTKTLLIIGVIAAGLLTSPSAAAAPHRIPEPPPLRSRSVTDLHRRLINDQREVVMMAQNATAAPVMPPVEAAGTCRRGSRRSDESFCLDGIRPCHPA